MKLLETVAENAVHLVAVERIVSLLLCEAVWALEEAPTARGDLLGQLNCIHNCGKAKQDQQNREEIDVAGAAVSATRADTQVGPLNQSRVDWLLLNFGPLVEEIFLFENGFLFFAAASAHVYEEALTHADSH